jgi:hypothetical protein
MSKQNESILIKKPNRQESYQDYQIEELNKCLDPVTGPLHFLKNYIYIQHPTRGRLLFEPYDYQIRFIDTMHRYRLVVGLQPRQSGKSLCAAAYMLWYAMFVPDSTILIAAHKYLGAQEIMQRIRFAYESVPDFIRAGSTSYNKGSLEFDNGSRIMAQTTTETTGRGTSISLLFLDEFSYVPPNIAKAFWISITPTLSTGGKAIITSTPNSDEDQYAIIWKQANKCIDEFGNKTDLGINGFKAFRSYWDEHPDRDKKWEQEQVALIGHEKFQREFACCNGNAKIELLDNKGKDLVISLEEFFDIIDK